MTGGSRARFKWWFTSIEKHLCWILNYYSRVWMKFNRYEHTKPFGKEVMGLVNDIEKVREKHKDLAQRILRG